MSICRSPKGNVAKEFVLTSSAHLALGWEISSQTAPVASRFCSETTRSILMLLLSNFFSKIFVEDQVVCLYSSTDMTTGRKNYPFISSERSDVQTVDNLWIKVNDILCVYCYQILLIRYYYQGGYKCLVKSASKWNHLKVAGSIPTTGK